MENNYVKCVKIVHDPAEVRVYRTLSAFFRFVGIFACENLVEDEYGSDVDWVCRVEEGSEENGEVYLKEQVEDELKKMKEKLGEDNFSVLFQIWELFDDNELMRASYAIDYFSDLDEKYKYIFQQMEKAIDNFKRVLEQLVELEKSREEHLPGNVYMWMAKANCQRRMNELSKILRKAVDENRYSDGSEKKAHLKKLSRQFIGFNEIDKNILKVLAVDRHFYAAYAVRGFVMENNMDCEVKSVDELRQAINEIGERQSYTSYLYFRIARYYEKIRHDLIKKMDNYRKAKEVDQHNFRAIYKLAVYEKEKNGKSRDYDKELDLWKCLLKVLQVKQNLPSLQPVECAYLYKAYIKIGDIYSARKSYEKGIRFYQKAEAVYNNTVNEDSEKGFYPWMFREVVVEDSGKKSWEIYKEAAREKLQIKKVYTKILDASSRGGLMEIHEKYV